MAPKSIFLRDNFSSYSRKLKFWGMYASLSWQKQSWSTWWKYVRRGMEIVHNWKQMWRQRTFFCSFWFWLILILCISIRWCWFWRDYTFYHVTQYLETRFHNEIDKTWNKNKVPSLDHIFSLLVIQRLEEKNCMYDCGFSWVLGKERLICNDSTKAPR